jgi:hypothetical protein
MQQHSDRRAHAAGASRERAKLGIACALLVVAGGMLAWYYGVFPFGSGHQQRALTPAELDQVAASRAIMEAELKKPGTTVHGS